MPTPQQGLPLFTAITVLIGTLVVIQLWLLSAAIDALLSGQESVLLPSGAASVALFLVNGGLLMHVMNFDRRVRDDGTNGQT